MNGVVNDALEATVRLTVVGLTGSTEITAVIDTGFNGSLSLPSAIVRELGLPALASKIVTLGDGKRKRLRFAAATAIWNGQERAVAVLCVEGDPLVGTALLRALRMTVDFLPGGPVTIGKIE